jgi:hypothetical protein
MATVQELSVLHRRYADTSHRFRAAWTFHQFIESLVKSVLGRTLEGYSTDFQDLYNELKEVSQSLNASEGDRLGGRLDVIDRRLGELVWALDEEDSKVPPDCLRQFFRRIKNSDEKILTQLVKFYLYAYQGDPAESWAPDRLDKVDFLLSRLCEEPQDPAGAPVLRDAKRLWEIFGGLWALLGAAPPAPEVVSEHRRAIEEVRAQAAVIEGLDDLNESGLVGRYRELKHGLGSFFFEPELALAVQETNLALRNKIERLYRQEERRIVAEYQRVFELEREVPIDGELDGELMAFRQDIERFERHLQRDEFRLQDIAQIRQRVRALLPRLSAAGRSGPGLHRPGDTAEIAVPAPLDLGGAEEVIGETYRRLSDALRELAPETPPETVVATPAIYAFRLEPREVVAFRRLTGPPAAECDRELEQFLVGAAALRMRLNDEAQEITGILDETSTTGEAPVYGRARTSARLADAFLWRFEHLIHQHLLAGDGELARQLQVLRMRLMRDYAGLWLLAYRPLFLRRAPEAEKPEL